jgi:hypothetical protein
MRSRRVWTVAALAPILIAMLLAASGLVWSLTIPFDPWVNQLILDHRPLPLAAQLGALVGEFNWAPAVALGITLPALLVPTVGCARAAGGRWRPPRWPPSPLAAALFQPLRRRVRIWWTGGSTAAATTPPAPLRASRSGCATSSTWTPWRASCRP